MLGALRELEALVIAGQGEDDAAALAGRMSAIVASALTRPLRCVPQVAGHAPLPLDFVRSLGFKDMDIKLFPQQPAADS